MRLRRTYQAKTALGALTVSDAVLDQLEEFAEGVRRSSLTGIRFLDEFDFPSQWRNYGPKSGSNKPPTIQQTAELSDYKLDKFYPKRPATIAQYGFEISVFDDHYAEDFISPGGVKKIFVVVDRLTFGEVDQWMIDNLPHFVAYGEGRVLKRLERAWINRHATGRYALTSIDGGVRFANADDAFWFKMART